VDFTTQVIAVTKSLDLNFEDKTVSIRCYREPVGILEVVGVYKPSVILLDYEFEATNTELYIKTLLAESPKSKVILLGNDLSNEVILNSLIHGAYGYLKYGDMDKFLLKAIISVENGQAWVTRKLVGLLIERFSWLI
jgi:DNA-binding NarL/FixJ family response regulator